MGRKYPSVDVESEPVEPTVTSLGEVDEHRLVQALHKLSAIVLLVEGKPVDWQVWFRVARELRVYFPVTESMASLWRWCCVFKENTPWSTSEIYSGVCAVWTKVRCAAGMDGWDAAWQWASSRDSRFSPSAPPEDWQQLVTALYIMQMEARGEAFPIPCSRIAKSMGLSVAQASRIRTTLVSLKIIEVADLGYSYTNKLSKTYRFIAKPQ